MIDLHKQLIEVMQAYPDYNIVTDMGASVFSGWGTFSTYEIDHVDKCIELFFD